MRYLTLSSLVLLCLSCGRPLYQGLTPTAADAQALKALKPAFTTLLYRTQIDVVGKHLSGLLFFKRLPDESFRVVFTNEVGLNLFDFHFATHQFEVIHCIEQLNKKAVINQLKKDIGFLLMTELDYSKGKAFTKGNENYYSFTAGKETTVYITDTKTQEISRIESASARKQKVAVSLTSQVAGMPDSVFIDHKLFAFTISLKQIQR